MSSLPGRILSQVRDIVRSMGLPGLDNRAIQIRRYPWDARNIYRGITIHSMDDRLGAGTNASDDVGYGVGITIVTGLADTSNLVERVPDWRDSIRDRFLNKTIPGVPEVYVCKVRLGDVYLPRQHRDGYDATQLVVRAWVEQHRT